MSLESRVNKSPCSFICHWTDAVRGLLGWQGMTCEEQSSSLQVDSWGFCQPIWCKAYCDTTSLIRLNLFLQDRCSIWDWEDLTNCGWVIIQTPSCERCLCAARKACSCFFAHAPKNMALKATSARTEARRAMFLLLSRRRQGSSTAHRLMRGLKCSVPHWLQPCATCNFPPQPCSLQLIISHFLWDISRPDPNSADTFTICSYLQLCSSVFCQNISLAPSLTLLIQGQVQERREQNDF